jgi:putative ABC transport system permease protein
MDQVRAALAKRQRFSPTDERAVMMFGREQFRPIIDAITIGLQMFFAFVGALTLGIGGVGVMNIMLVSVTERTREIGIRLSVGARTSDILIQFLTEAVVLSLAGGLIGVLLSFGVAYILNNYTSQAALIRPEIILLAFGFAGMIGIFFGFYPSRKAANLNPIDALRYE